MPNLEIIVVALVHCNIVNNNYQQDSTVLYIYIPNKSFCQLLDISPKNFTFLKTFNSEFSYIGVWFTSQNSKPLEIVICVILWFVTSDLIGNKIANKIAKVSRSSLQNKLETITIEHDKEIPKERYIFPEGIHKIIDDLTLI